MRQDAADWEETSLDSDLEARAAADAAAAAAAGDPDRGSLPSDRGRGMGGTLAGEDVEGGSVILHGRRRPPGVPVSDSTGETVIVDPALAGTVAGNTTAAGVVVAKGADEEPAYLTEDLGPEGTIIQEVGGEARH
jgi:hypothetical protein